MYKDWKRRVLRYLSKVFREVESRNGQQVALLFHCVRVAATPNARSLTAQSRVRGTHSLWMVDDSIITIPIGNYWCRQFEVSSSIPRHARRQMLVRALN